MLGAVLAAGVCDCVCNMECLFIMNNNSTNDDDS